MPISHTHNDSNTDAHEDDLDNYDRPKARVDDEDDLSAILGEAAAMNIGKQWGNKTPVVVLTKPLAPLNEVRRLSDTEIDALEAVQSGARLAAKGDRQSWCFKDMNIYDSVRIGAEVASKAQAAVHTYSQRTKRKFSTKRHSDKSLQVTRLR